MSATVVRVDSIERHPSADRLLLLRLAASGIHGWTYGWTVVTGDHYEQDQLGVYIEEGAWIPGWLAKDLWIGSGSAWVHVDRRELRGIWSPGVFAGAKFRPNPGLAWQAWRGWSADWKTGDDVTAELGIVAFDPTSIGWRE